MHWVLSIVIMDIGKRWSLNVLPKPYSFSTLLLRSGNPSLGKRSGDSLTKEERDKAIVEKISRHLPVSDQYSEQIEKLEKVENITKKADRGESLREKEFWQ